VAEEFAFMGQKAFMHPVKDVLFHDRPIPVFFTRCPSFLSFQRAMEESRGRNNARSLFGVDRIPCDNHIRQTLDPVEPCQLFSLFDELHAGFEQVGLLEAMRAVGRTRLIALDATWYFSSQSENIHCPHCSRIEHQNGQCTHYHNSFITDGAYRLLRDKIGAHRTFFDHIRTLRAYLDFENGSHLMDFMMKGLEIGPCAAQKS
jgi:hypothetical protein